MKFLKMKKISLKYSIAGCFKVFVRSPIMALAALCLLTGTLVVFAFTFAVTHNIDSIGENEGNVGVFLSDECDENAVAEVREILLSLMDDKIVDDIDYISKSEALEEQKERYPEYLDNVGGFTVENSPYKARYVVSVVDDSGYSKVKNAIKDLEFEKLDEDGNSVTYNPIHRVYDDGEEITKIENAGDKLVGFLGILIPLMLLVCIVLISAVIRMGIFDKREEISLMRIIGSTHTYISAQFVIEGITVGLVSALLSIASIRFMYGALIEKITESVKLFAPLAFSEIALGVVLISLFFGIFAGVAGSLIATTRYIRRD